jgi:hypothetical protein
MIKEEVGNAPDFVDIFMKAIIPVTTTMIVSVKGILRAKFILIYFSFPIQIRSTIFGGISPVFASHIQFYLP